MKDFIKKISIFFCCLGFSGCVIEAPTEDIDPVASHCNLMPSLCGDTETCVLIDPCGGTCDSQDEDCPEVCVEVYGCVSQLALDQDCNPWQDRCGEGLVCLPMPNAPCEPSFCNEEVCTADCRLINTCQPAQLQTGDRCVPSNNECGEGLVCLPMPNAPCEPSFCNEEVCTSDCREINTCQAAEREFAAEKELGDECDPWLNECGADLHCLLADVHCRPAEDGPCEPSFDNEDVCTSDCTEIYTCQAVEKELGDECEPRQNECGAGLACLPDEDGPCRPSFCDDGLCTDDCVPVFSCQLDPIRYCDPADPVACGEGEGCREMERPLDPSDCNDNFGCPDVEPTQPVYACSSL